MRHSLSVSAIRTESWRWQYANRGTWFLFIHLVVSRWAIAVSLDGFVELPTEYCKEFRFEAVVCMHARKMFQYLFSYSLVRAVRANEGAKTMAHSVLSTPHLLRVYINGTMIRTHVTAQVQPPILLGSRFSSSNMETSTCFTALQIHAVVWPLATCIIQQPCTLIGHQGTRRHICASEGRA